MIRMLLEYGADINAQNDVGATPLHWATNHGLSEVICVLLEQGADPNISNNNDHATPLHRAVQAGSSTTVRPFLEHGVDVDAVDKMGKTALRYAQDRMLEEIVTLLLAHGANDS